MGILDSSFGECSPAGYDEVGLTFEVERAFPFSMAVEKSVCCGTAEG